MSAVLCARCNPCPASATNFMELVNEGDEKKDAIIQRTMFGIIILLNNLLAIIDISDTIGWFNLSYS